MIKAQENDGAIAVLHDEHRWHDRITRTISRRLYFTVILPPALQVLGILCRSTALFICRFWPFSTRPTRPIAGSFKKATSSRTPNFSGHFETIRASQIARFKN